MCWWSSLRMDDSGHVCHPKSLSVCKSALHLSSYPLLWTDTSTAFRTAELAFFSSQSHIPPTPTPAPFSLHLSSVNHHPFTRCQIQGRSNHLGSGDEVGFSVVSRLPVLKAKHL
jgi:hypothetical protein